MKILASLSLWAILAAVAGAQIGYHQGYTRGVRDLGLLLILLHNAEGELPTAESKRGVRL